MTKKICIVNYYTDGGREDYKLGTLRLTQTLDNVGYEGDMIIFSPSLKEEDTVKEYDFTKGGKIIRIASEPFNKKYGNALSHKEAPYQFKSYIIQYAKEQGYDKVIWLDSSVIVTRNLNHYLTLLEELGVILFDNPGCLESTWTADNCLEIMGCSVEAARTFFEIDAAIMLFNFRTKKANDFFEEYMKYCQYPSCLKGEVCIREDFKAHRHDQSIASYIARIKHNILPLNYGAWCYFDNFASGEFPKATFLKCGIQVPMENILYYINRNKEY